MECFLSPYDVWLHVANLYIWSIRGHVMERDCSPLFVMLWWCWLCTAVPVPTRDRCLHPVHVYPVHTEGKASSGIAGEGKTLEPRAEAWQWQYGMTWQGSVRGTLQRTELNIDGKTIEFGVVLVWCLYYSALCGWQYMYFRCYRMNVECITVFIYSIVCRICTSFITGTVFVVFSMNHI